MAFFLASASAAFFSASAFFTSSTSSLFFLASSFSCSALISFLLACFSDQLLLFPLLPGKLLFLLGSDFFPLGLLFLQSLEFLLLFRPLVPPLINIILQLFVELILLQTSFPLSKGLITFHRGLGCVGHPLILIVRHDDCLVFLPLHQTR